MADITIIPLPANIKSIAGLHFGRLTVVGYGGKFKRVHKWVCRCDCGVYTLKRADHMGSGRSASCGCFNAELQKSNFQTHGGAASDKANRHPLYSVWCGMKKRCYTKSSTQYPHYGGRGIKVCAEWLFDFARFVSDMGDRPEGCSIDRIDSDGDYSAQNCRWADHSTQMKNRRPFKRGSRINVGSHNPI